MDKKIVNVAIIGLGMVAETHLRAIADLADLVHLRGIHARKLQVMEDFAAKAEALCGTRPIFYNSIEEIAADEGVDCVLLLTPPNARYAILQTIAGAGKHVLMEKPVERSLNAARELVELCASNEVHLGIVFQHRVRAASVQLAQLLGSGKLGKLGLAEIAVPWWRDQSYYDEPGRGTLERDGGGVLISQAIHTLDLLISLTGEISQVVAMARTTRFHSMECEDFVTAGLDFACGATGALVASTASFPGDAESITLHFDHGVTRLKSGILNVTWRDGREETFGTDAATGGGTDPMAFTHDWHRDIIADFANCIVHDRPPLVTGREALKVHALIEALIESSASGQAVQVEIQGDE